MDRTIPYISTVIASFLPIENELVKYQVGSIIADFGRIIFSSNKWGRVFRCRKNNRVIIFNKTDDEEPNQIYFKLEEYIVKKFVTNINSCELVPKKGEIEFSIYDEFQSSKFQEDFSNDDSVHTIDISFEMLKKASKRSDYMSDRRAIVFSSKTANLDIIKKYVKSICRFKIHNKIVTIYRPIEKGSGKSKDKSVEWDTVYIRTNKTRDNTFYSEELDTKFFDDIDWYMDNEVWFCERGVPYKRGYVLHGPPGTGKCLHPDTLVMTFDGNTKKAKDVKINDILMGDDSTPRKVLSTTSGCSKMYEVIYKNGSYIVNKDHVLSLVIILKPYIYPLESKYEIAWIDRETMEKKTLVFSNISEAECALPIIRENYKEKIDITVEKYYNLPENVKEYLKGYKVPVIFERKDVRYDPYIIGYLVGDRYWRDDNLVRIDNSVILSYFNYVLKKYGYILEKKFENQYQIGNINNIDNIYTHRYKHRYKFIKNLMKKSSDGIPYEYRTNSPENLLRLLSGIIDSKGYYDRLNRRYELCLRSEVLADNIAFVSRSLGFLTIKEDLWVSISGNGLEKIPVLLERNRGISSDVSLRTDITVYPFDDYHKYNGFSIDKNHRFLLGDHTVTHNSTMAKIVANKYNLPIFMIDLSTIDNNSDLVRLVTEINYYSRNEKYILLLEDVDRSKIITSRYDTNMTADCLLNVLDGVVETHGRICIMTSNFVDRLRRIPALMRPGRIDRCLELGYCTEKQIKKLAVLFFPDMDLEGMDINLKITPAELVCLLQDNHATPDKVLQKFEESKVINTKNETSILGGYSKNSYNPSRSRISRNRRYNRKKRTMLEKVKRKFTSTEKNIKLIEKKLESYRKNLPELKEKLSIEEKKDLGRKAKEKMKEEERKKKEQEKKRKDKERKDAKKKKEQERKRKEKARLKGKMIVNPKTGRLVSLTGPTGRMIIAKNKSNKKPETPEESKKPEEFKESETPEESKKSGKPRNLEDFESQQEKYMSESESEYSESEYSDD